MESRFRVRFWPSRRKKQVAHDLDLHSVPYQTAENSKEPIFIHQSLGRNLTEKRRKNEVLSLRTSAYESTKPGRSPEFGERPQKGNGPVKLQTSRRLSSGELITTTQDAQRTIDDIRNSEYIVAGNENRNSRSLSRRSIGRPASAEPSASAPSFFQQHSPPRFAPPSTQSTWSTFPASSPLLDIPEDPATFGSPSLSIASAPGVLIASQHPPFRGPITQRQKAPTEGLGLTDAQPMPHGILKTSQVSLLEPHEEQNATIRALWKAEYTRLVAIYGQNGVDRNIIQLKHDSGPTHNRREEPPQVDDQPFAFTLDPLPRPSFEARNGASKRRSSRASHGEGNQQEDTSDESSQKRLSAISSAEYASSFTTRTSVADSDMSSTKEDIRRTVDNMRSAYIQALDAKEPSLHAVKTMKKKKTKRHRSPPQSTPRTSTTLPLTPDSAEKHASVPLNISPNLRLSQRSTKTTSQIAGINKLPAIQASPHREREPEVGLKRADSNTLGALMGEHRRSSIQKRKSKTGSRRSSTLISRPSADSTEVQSSEDAANNRQLVTPPPEVEPQVDSLYQDIFLGSGSDFWQSEPDLLSSAFGIPTTRQDTVPPGPTTPTKMPTAIPHTP